MTGFDVASIRSSERPAALTASIVRHTALFVGGFTAVFVALGMSANAATSTFAADRMVITRVSGVVIVAMALFLAGSQVLATPRLYREWRLRVDPGRFGSLAAPVAGAAFGFAWTPCIGPVLASVLTVAATSTDGARAALLLCAYSLGLGVPFVATGALLGRLAGPLAWVQRHLRALTFVSAGLLVALGVLVVAGHLSLIDNVSGGLG
jgi:cytochrome c-type biogenesis protein